MNTTMADKANTTRRWLHAACFLLAGFMLIPISGLAFGTMIGTLLLFAYSGWIGFSGRGYIWWPVMWLIPVALVIAAFGG